MGPPALLARLESVLWRILNLVLSSLCLAARPWICSGRPEGGAVIFVCLVSVTIKLSPTPLSLTPHSLARLERRLVAAGKANLAELAQSVEEWERSVVRFGEAGLEAVESALSSVGPHNVADLTHRLASYGTDRLAEADAALHRAVANLLDAQWPIRRWPVYVFLGGAIACMFISSLCHLLGCCAEHIATRLWRFDYVGIAVLVVTSIVPPVYYVFFCHPTARAVYLAAASVLGAATVAVSLFPAFQHPDYYALRAGTFVALGAWGVIPLMHGWSLHFGEQAVGFAVGLECVMAAIYLAGAALYTLRVPERWKPGFFDVVGHSHQLFHVAVVVAACVHFKATHILLQWREGVGGCVAPGEKAFL
ncbi:hemolysin-III-like protein [Helicosporidium sp. ATCC 50920]|nr:hemolysin-III-like protein [Helicosporidium sp. ATCC 50920]|eukprot:KDD76029.1 hemolysin-III-like protein [Helicosporidium sp. ATCC 50920]